MWTQFPLPPFSVGMRGRSPGTGTTGADASFFGSFAGSFIGSIGFGIDTGGWVVGVTLCTVPTVGTQPTVVVAPHPHAGAELQPWLPASRARRRANKPTRGVEHGSQQPVLPMAKLDRRTGPQQFGAAVAVYEGTKLDRTGVPQGVAPHGEAATTGAFAQGQALHPDDRWNRPLSRSNSPGLHGVAVPQAPHALAPNVADANVGADDPHPLHPAPLTTTGA